MKGRWCVFVVTFLLLLSRQTFAVDRLVPSQYATIQHAINASTDTDVVIVAPNTYSGPGNVDIDCNGLAIIVRSTDPNNPDIVAATIINCDANQSSPHRAFWFHNAEDANTVLNGLTIMNGYADYGGAVLSEANSAPLISNCILKKCRASVSGGAVYGDAQITDCTIRDNWAGLAGGAIANYKSILASKIMILSDCEILFNISDVDGGALAGCLADVLNCNINYNEAAGSGGAFYNCCGTVTDCNICNNTALAGSGGAFSGYNDTIRGCNITDNIAHLNGGGIRKCIGLTTDCFITGNTAGGSGGGAYDCNSITDSVFFTNKATHGGALSCCYGLISACRVTGNLARYGGGLKDCNAVIENCWIYSNDADLDGGALNNCDSNIVNCYIFENSAYWGGGLYNCDGTIEKTIIAKNTADQGAGLYYSDAEIINCTITGNNAVDGSGLYFCDAGIANSIIWANTAINQSSQIYMSGATVTYSCIQGGYTGLGNINTDPCFADFDNADYHLKSSAGRWDPNNLIWVYDINKNSLCIDAGHPGSDWTAELWPHGQRINMGAYGGTAEASLSPSQGGIQADLNIDYCVNFRDFALFSADWMTNGNPLPGDFDRDAIVDFNDLAILIGSWLNSAEPNLPAAVADGFETGNFTSYPWTFSGNAVWSIETDPNNTHEGVFSAGSGSIIRNQTSTIKITIDAGYQCNTISFYRKVSSEADCDFLKFYIDDVLQNQWSGQLNWALQVYSIAPGEHTFKWTYQKDYSGSYGSDRAWIDDFKIYFDPRN
ncbi:MAG: hypothetical protein ABIG61_04455 [Planctomycetota bacterium]